MCRELRMVSYSQHGSKQFCYNTSVSLKRDLLFDIGGRHPAPAIGPKPIWVDGKTPVGRDDPIAPPRGVAETHPPPTVETAFNRRLPLVGSRVPRDRRPGEPRKRIRRPQHVRNSVLVLPRKPLLSTDEARIRCCAVWQSCGATSFPMLRPGS